MGTHPIFESDFDCLTDLRKMVETQEPVPPKANSASLNRQKKLLALNAENQKSYEKKVKKLKKKGTGKLEGGPGVMYVGHLSPEFLEPEIRGYFGQFGTIQRCRLSRSKKTGRSRGFAFIEFSDIKDAKIAAKTMDKYLMHERIMKCAIIPKDKVHESLWKGANQKWNHGGLYRKQRMLYNKEKTSEQISAAKTKREAKDIKLKAFLKELGVDDVEFPDGSGVEPTESPPKKKAKKATETTVTPRQSGRRKRQLPEAVPESISDSKKSK